MNRNHPIFILLLLLLVAGIFGFGLRYPNRIQKAAPAADALEAASGPREGGLKEGSVDACLAFQPVRSVFLANPAGGGWFAHSRTLEVAVRCSCGWRLPLRI